MPVTVPAWFVATVLLLAGLVLVARFAVLQEPADRRLTAAVGWLWLALVGKTLPVQNLAADLELLTPLRVAIHVACMLAAVALAGAARRARFGMYEPPRRYVATLLFTGLLGVPMLVIALLSADGQPESAGWWGVLYFVLFVAPIAYGLSVGLAALRAARREREGRIAAIFLATLFVAFFVDSLSNLVAALDRAMDASGVAAAARAATTGSIFVAFVGIAAAMIGVSGLVTYRRGVPGLDRLHVERVRAMWADCTGQHNDVRLLEASSWWMMSAEELTMRLRVEIMDSWRRLLREQSSPNTELTADATASALQGYFRGESPTVPAMPMNLETFVAVAMRWPVTG